MDSQAQARERNPLVISVWSIIRSSLSHSPMGLYRRATMESHLLWLNIFHGEIIVCVLFLPFMPTHFFLNHNVWHTSTMSWAQIQELYQIFYLEKGKQCSTLETIVLTLRLSGVKNCIASWCAIAVAHQMWLCECNGNLKEEMENWLDYT